MNDTPSYNDPLGYQAPSRNKPVKDLPLSLDGALSEGSFTGQKPPAPYSAPDGHYQWVPAEKKKWRKRHPFLFWGGILLLLFFIVNIACGIFYEFYGPPKIAVVNVDDVILDSKDVVEWVEKVRNDGTIKAVVVRINSPGGGVGASQEIYYALSRVSARKPVIASMGSLAASGGYYVALPAKRIFAVPSTLTGSIGVKMSLPNAEGLMKTIGISSTTLASGDLKDAGSPFREMTEKERAYLQGIIDDMYDDFVTAVSTHRNLDKKDIYPLADGRGITGRQALQAKLVDELGDMIDAVNFTKKEIGLDPSEKVRLVVGPEKPERYLERVLSGSIRNVLGKSTTQAQPVFMY